MEVDKPGCERNKKRRRNLHEHKQNCHRALSGGGDNVHLINERKRPREFKLPAQTQVSELKNKAWIPFFLWYHSVLNEQSLELECLSAVCLLASTHVV